MERMETVSNQEMIQEIKRHLHILNSLSIPWSSKGIAYIGLAFEYFNIGMDQEGISLLLEIPEDFYEKDMLTALEGNSQFLQVVLLLVDLMIKSPNIPKDSEIMKSFFKLKGRKYGTA